MDLRPTGSDRLLEIKTDCVTFMIKGKRRAYRGAGEKENSILVVKGVNVKDILVNGQSTIVDKQDGATIRQIQISPMFFEQTYYEIIVQSICGGEVSFWHENSLIREKVSAITDDRKLLTGVVNFQNSIGFSEFIIGTEDKEELIVRIEVYPTKVSYKEDYQHMLQDITEEVYAVAIDFIKQTYQNFTLEDNGDTVPAAFFQVLSYFFTKFVQATNKIIAAPHHRLETEYSVLPIHKVKRVDHGAKIWLEKHSEYVQVNNGNVLAKKALTFNKSITYNTLENQFVKYVLMDILVRLKDFKRRYQKNYAKKEAYIFERIASMSETINRLVNGSFLKNVDRKSVV